MIDVFPSEWVGTYHEKELGKALNVGDKVRVVVDSQFKQDDMIGTVIELDPEDEWGYRVSFADGIITWYKRYHLEVIDDAETCNTI